MQKKSEEEIELEEVEPKPALMSSDESLKSLDALLAFYEDKEAIKNFLSRKKLRKY